MNIFFASAGGRSPTSSTVRSTSRARPSPKASGTSLAAVNNLFCSLARVAQCYPRS